MCFKELFMLMFINIDTVSLKDLMNILSTFDLNTNFFMF